MFYTFLAILYVCILIGISLAYALMMKKYYDGWYLHPDFSKLVLKEYQLPSITIVIPARNEENSLGACLESLLNQSLNPTNIIVIDDDSEDQTAAIALSYPQVSLIRLKDHPDFNSTGSTKKLAISCAIDSSNDDLIVCIDADCVAHKEWLKSMLICYQNGEQRLLTGPVLFEQSNSLLKTFQALDFTGMMGITASGLYYKDLLLANGANMLYEKSLFHEVDGFKGVDHLASGDDVFLLQKVLEINPNWAGFAKHPEAHVVTEAPENWSSLIQQRVRWGSKMTHTGNNKTLLVMLLVFLASVLILMSPVIIISFFISGQIWEGYVLAFSWIVLLNVKGVFDYRLLYSTTCYFGQSQLMNYFFPAQLWHIIYITVIGLVTNFKKEFHWKGRPFKHPTSSAIPGQ